MEWSDAGCPDPYRPESPPLTDEDIDNMAREFGQS
jgi:hypothetical protein